MLIKVKSHIGKKILYNRTRKCNSVEERTAIKQLIELSKEDDTFITSYKEMLSCLNINEFLSCVKIKEKKRNK